MPSDWWTAFGDPALDETVALALERNQSLLAAVARLDQAAEDARIAGSGLQPGIQAGFSSSRRKQNFIGFPIPGREERVLSTISTNLGVSIDTAWEADLWGRLRADARAALADLQASAADLRGAQLSIAGQVVKAWFAAAEAQEQLHLAEATVASFRRSTDGVRERFEQGLRPPLDLRLALSNLAGAEALLAERRQQLDAVIRQLEVLLGRYPGRRLQPPTTLRTSSAAVPIS